MNDGDCRLFLWSAVRGPWWLSTGRHGSKMQPLLFGEITFDRGKRWGGGGGTGTGTGTGTGDGDGERTCVVGDVREYRQPVPCLDTCLYQRM